VTKHELHIFCLTTSGYKLFELPTYLMITLSTIWNINLLFTSLEHEHSHDIKQLKTPLENR